MTLEIKGLSKEFGGLTAINNLNLNVRKHELLGIIGPNGAGKSTLFNLLTGVVLPTRGEILFEGKNITNLPRHMFARKGIARTFQTTRIFPGERVFDNVMVGLIPNAGHGLWHALVNRAKKDDRFLFERCEKVLRLVDLEEKAGTLAGQLDQEKQKRLAIGIAMATDPKILFLDEPSGGINLDEIKNLIQIIRRISKTGTTICLIEHKMKMVMELCDRIAVLNYGEKIAEGTLEEIRSNEKAIKAYLGDEYAA